MLIYPGLTLLDLVGPQGVLSSMPDTRVHLVWKDRNAILTNHGTGILPSMTFAECPEKLDVLFVPGGTMGTLELMKDRETLRFLQERAAGARYVTSVCTGSLVLGAAGLLRGYRAASHWSTRDLLSEFGAIPAAERVVEDRNRITGGGVTAGIDFGLVLAGRMRGNERARAIQLQLEYDPHPPFTAGSPESAGAETVEMVKQRLAPFLVAAASAVREAARSMH